MPRSITDKQYSGIKHLLKLLKLLHPELRVAPVRWDALNRMEWSSYDSSSEPETQWVRPSE